MKLRDYIDTLKGKRIAVLGIGISNTPLIRLLLAGGCQVTACDQASREKLGPVALELEALGASLRLGPDYLDDLDFDLIFRTPGMHPFTPQLQKAAQAGAEITSEMEVFMSLCPGRMIAITGSDGKTTTSTIISELLKAGGYKVHLGGNIGKPLLADTDLISPEDFVVLELSSFQLHSMRCRPHVAVVTNISPNHLDVHPDFQDYMDAKKNIYLGQGPGDRLVLNADEHYCRDFSLDAPSRVTFFSRREAPKDGVFLQDGMIYAAEGFEVEALMPASAIFIPGEHNVENYMAAYAAVRDFVSPQTLRAVAASFRGVSHRLEIVRVLRGVKYVNDSIASSPTRTIAGLRSFDVKPILIAGGYDKHIPFDGLGTEIVKNVKALFLTGDTAEKIKRAVTRDVEYDPMTLPITVTEDFTEAVLLAHKAAEEGDVVLLSPACASYDKFRNFAQRGDRFREIVLELG